MFAQSHGNQNQNQQSDTTIAQPDAGAALSYA